MADTLLFSPSSFSPSSVSTPSPANSLDDLFPPYVSPPPSPATTYLYFHPHHQTLHWLNVCDHLFNNPSHTILYTFTPTSSHFTSLMMYSNIIQLFILFSFSLFTQIFQVLRRTPDFHSTSVIIKGTINLHHYQCSYYSQYLLLECITV